MQTDWLVLLLVLPSVTALTRSSCREVFGEVGGPSFFRSNPGQLRYNNSVEECWTLRCPLNGRVSFRRFSVEPGDYVVFGDVRYTGYEVPPDYHFIEELHMRLVTDAVAASTGFEAMLECHDECLPILSPGQIHATSPGRRCWRLQCSAGGVMDITFSERSVLDTALLVNGAAVTSDTLSGLVPDPYVLVEFGNSGTVGSFTATFTCNVATTCTTPSAGELIEPSRAAVPQDTNPFQDECWLLQCPGTGHLSFKAFHMPGLWLGVGDLARYTGSTLPTQLTFETSLYLHFQSSSYLPGPTLVTDGFAALFVCGGSAPVPPALVPPPVPTDTSACQLIVMPATGQEKVPGRNVLRDSYYNDSVQQCWTLQCLGHGVISFTNELVPVADSAPILEEHFLSLERGRDYLFIGNKAYTGYVDPPDTYFEESVNIWFITDESFAAGGFLAKLRCEPTRNTAAPETAIPVTPTPETIPVTPAPETAIPLTPTLPRGSQEALLSFFVKDSETWKNFEPEREGTTVTVPTSAVQHGLSFVLQLPGTGQHFKRPGTVTWDVVDRIEDAPYEAQVAIVPDGTTRPEPRHFHISAASDNTLKVNLTDPGYQDRDSVDIVLRYHLFLNDNKYEEICGMRSNSTCSYTLAFSGPRASPPRVSPPVGAKDGLPGTDTLDICAEVLCGVSRIVTLGVGLLVPKSGSFGVTTPGHLGRGVLLRRIFECKLKLPRDPDTILHPLQFSMGHGPYREYLGAAVGNTALAAGFLLLVGAVAAGLSATGRITEDKSPLFAVAAAKGNLGYKVLLFLLCGVVHCCCVLLFYEEATGTRVAVACFLAAFLMFPVVALVIALQVGSHTTLRRVLREGSPKWVLTLLGEKDWVGLHTSLDNAWVAVHNPVFGKYRQGATGFLVFELLVLLAISGLSAWMPNTRDGCIMRASAVFGCCFSLLVATAVLRVYYRAYEMVGEVIILLLEVLLSLILTISAAKDDGDPSLSTDLSHAASAVAGAHLVATALKFCIDLAALVTSQVFKDDYTGGKSTPSNPPYGHNEANEPEAQVP